MKELMDMIIKDTITCPSSLDDWHWLVDRPVKFKSFYYPLHAWAIGDDGKEFLATHIHCRIHLYYRETLSKELCRVKYRTAYMTIYFLVKEAIDEGKVLLFQWLKEKEVIKK